MLVDMDTPARVVDRTDPDRKWLAIGFPMGAEALGPGVRGAGSLF